MIVAYLKHDQRISMDTTLPGRMRVYVDTEINQDGSRAQVYIPIDHPTLGGVRTVIPKTNLMLDLPVPECTHG